MNPISSYWNIIRSSNQRICMAILVGVVLLIISTPAFCCLTQHLTGAPITVSLTASSTDACVGQTVTITANAYDMDETANGTLEQDTVSFFEWNVDGVVYSTCNSCQNVSQISVPLTEAGPKHITVSVNDTPLYYDDDGAEGGIIINANQLANPPIIAAASHSISADGPWQGGVIDLATNQTAHFRGDDPDNLSVDQDPSECDYANDGISSYSWTFGDGATGTGVSVTHSFLTAGTYTGSLIVNDTGTYADDPASEPAEFLVRVFDNPPAAPVISSPQATLPYPSLTPTIVWTGEIHDEYQVKIGVVADEQLPDDPDDPNPVWDSGVVTEEDTQVICGSTLSENTFYYVFVREHNVVGWSPWSASVRFTVKDNSVLPRNVSASPNSGSFLIDTPTTFTATYSDYCGYSHIKNMELLIDESTLDQIDACYLRYEPSTNSCWLMDNGGTEWTGGFEPGSTNVLENDQVKVYLDLTTVSGSDETMTVNWNIEFKAAFSGSKTESLAVINNENAGDPLNYSSFGTIDVVTDGVSSTITSPANGSYIKDLPITISGTATDPESLGVEKVEVSTDGGQTWQDAMGTDNWSYTWTGASDGSYVIKTRATSSGSQVEVPGTGVKVTIDTGIPQSTITAPEDGATVTGTQVEVTGTASDKEGNLAKVEVSIDDGVTWAEAEGAEGFTYSFPIPEVGGTYTIKSRATDQAGNVEIPGAGITITAQYEQSPEMMAAASFEASLPTGDDPRFEAQKSLPWGPYGNLNLCTGNVITVVPVVGWDSMGDVGIDFSLVHIDKRYGVSKEGGWTHSYDSYIKATTDSVKAYSPDGNVQEWGRNSAGSFYRPIVYGSFMGDQDTISAVTAGGYLIESKGHIKRYFTKRIDKKWYLEKIEYPVKPGKPAQTVILAYNNNLLSSVADPDLRRFICVSWTKANGGDVVKSVTYPCPYGGTRNTTNFIYGSRSLTINYPIVDSTKELPYAPTITKGDPVYPNPSPFYYNPVSTVFTWDGYKRITKVTVPAASTTRTTDDWTFTYPSSGGPDGKYTLTNPLLNVTTVNINYPRGLIPNGKPKNASNVVPANSCITTTVTDARHIKTTYRHVMWHHRNGDFCINYFSGEEETFKYDPFEFNRDFWVGYRLFDIERMDKGQPRTEQFNWTGCQYISGSGARNNWTHWLWPNNEMYSNVTVPANPTSWGGLRWYIDPKTYKTEYQWDIKGNLTKVTDPNDKAITATYDYGFCPKVTTSPMGRSVENTYDPVTYDLLNSVTHTNPDPNKDIIREYVYDDYGNLERDTGSYYMGDGSANAQVVTHTYDDLYHSYEVKTKNENTGRYVTSGYGPLGNKFWDTTPRFVSSDPWGVQLADYDKMGRKYYSWTSAKDGSRAAVTEYYGNGLVKKVTDSNGYVTTSEYDPLGNIKQVKQQENDSLWTYTDYTYNEVGALTKVELSRDGINKITVVTYDYDDLNRLKTIKTASNATTTYEYDKNGNISQQTDPSGRTTTFTYKPLTNWIDTCTFAKPGLTSKTITYEYDDDGLLIKVFDWTVSGSPAQEFFYDGAGRLTEVTRRDTGRKIHYLYTSDGSKSEVRICDLNDANEKKFTYEYYIDGKLKSIRDPFGVVTTYNYDFRGRIETKVVMSGASTVESTKHVYDDSQSALNGYADATDRTSELINYGPDGVTAYYDGLYSYDNADNITAKVESIRNPALSTSTTLYNYDKLYQLTSESRDGVSHSYGYDLFRNRVTNDSITYTYDADNKLLSSTDGYTYGYDADGNMISKVNGGNTVAAYTFDVDGNLINVTANGKSIGYTYNGTGERIVRTDGSTQAKYVFADGTLMQELDGTGALKVWYNPGISQTSGLNTSYFSHNLQGSTVGMVTGGSNADTFVYDAWGNQVSRTGTRTTPFQYVGSEGYYADKDNGLLKLGARYYDPTIGRFISNDPARDGVNWYGYAENNPVAEIDPTGHYAQLKDPHIPETGTATQAISRRLVTWGRGILNAGKTVVAKIAPYSKAITTAGLTITGTFVLAKSTAGPEYDMWHQGFASFGDLKKKYPSGPDMVWHHVVEQRMIERHKGEKDFSPENIHSVGAIGNCKLIPTSIHQKISDYYSSKDVLTTGEGYKTVRDWMNVLSYKRQHEEGLRILNDFLQGRKP